MNYYSTIKSLFIVCSVILFTACEGNYTHTYRINNNSSETVALIKSSHETTTTDSINYYDSLMVDTFLVEPNESRIISTYDDFGNMPRDQESCFYVSYSDTVYELNSDTLVPSFLGTNLKWVVTDYDKNEGQVCTTTITNSILNSSGF